METNNKLREALEAALKTIRGVINGTISPRSNTVFDCRDKLSAALAAPPRNCDVGTADEQSERYDKFCDIHDCRSDCPLFKADSCKLAWAQMPYEEANPKGAAK